jgi:F-type H+-transporting ATPase subunit gamma
MSGAALRERLRLLDELRQIVTAMRNLAYAELQRVNRAQAAQVKAEQVAVRALADTACAIEEPPSPPPTEPVWLVVGAERGFCGGFNDQLADALAEPIQQHADAHWLVAGARLRQCVEDMLPEATWLAGCNGTDEAAACVDSWLSSLVALEQRLVSQVPELWVMHHAEHGIVQRKLLPLPDLPAPSPGPAPLRYLSRAQLLPKLLAEMARVGLLGALYQSLQQENHWRLAQMQRAQDYLDDAGTRLRHRYFRERQSDITSELETLMSSLDLRSPS